MAWMVLICHLSPEGNISLYGSPKMLGNLMKQKKKMSDIACQFLFVL